jgi:hypothetical protein
MAKHHERAHTIKRHLRAGASSRKEPLDLRHRIERIEQLLDKVLSKMERFDSLRRGIWVPIETFVPEPYDVLKPLTAVVTAANGGFEAGLYEANLYAYGDTEAEAIAELKTVALETFDRLTELSEDQLGTGPARQKTVLTAHIARRPSVQLDLMSALKRPIPFDEP